MHGVVEWSAGLSEAEVPVDDLLCQAGCMGPPKRQAEQRVGVLGCAYSNAANAGFWQANAPKAVGKVNAGNVWRRRAVALLLQNGTNVQKCGERELWGWSGAIGIEGLHIDNESSLGWAFALDEGFCIGEPRVQGHETSLKQGIQHGLYKGAVRRLLRRRQGIGQEETPWSTGGPYVRRNGNMTHRTNAFLGKRQGNWLVGIGK